jgi:hypothetical protein
VRRLRGASRRRAIKYLLFVFVFLEKITARAGCKAAPAVLNLTAPAAEQRLQSAPLAPPAAPARYVFLSYISIKK